MTKIEIVAHCFCPPGLGFYAECLKWQWASLINYRPSSCVIDYTVCYVDSDAETKRRIAMCMKEEPDNVYMRPLCLAPHQLFRRAIGRNLRALGTDADIVWMTDVDYLFGFQCLDRTAELVDPETSKLCMPARYRINIDHATGDKMLQAAAKVNYPAIDEDLFVERKQKIAIGGLQILGGNFAREHGYLKDTKHIEPVTAHEGFRSCKCDRWFRAYHKLKTERLDIPNLFRIRHTKAGRDYLSDGTKGVGKEAW